MKRRPLTEVAEISGARSPRPHGSGGFTGHILARPRFVPMLWPARNPLHLCDILRPSRVFSCSFYHTLFHLYRPLHPVRWRRQGWPPPRGRKPRLEGSGIQNSDGCAVRGLGPGCAPPSTLCCRTVLGGKQRPGHKVQMSCGQREGGGPACRRWEGGGGGGSSFGNLAPRSGRRDTGRWEVLEGTRGGVWGRLMRRRPPGLQPTLACPCGQSVSRGSLRPSPRSWSILLKSGLCIRQSARGCRGSQVRCL